MKNKIIVATIFILSISMLPLSGPTTPTPCPPESFESDSGEELGDGNGCEPLNDKPEQERPTV